MIPQIYKIDTIGLGTLYAMAKPSAEWLKDDIEYLNFINVNLVVSLLEKKEESDLGLTMEQEIIMKAGMGFISHEIADRGLPSEPSFKKLVESLYLKLNQGESVAIHCRAGIGRTGVLASCLLIRNGVNPEMAIEQVSTARGVKIPDTREQVRFIHHFSKIHNIISI